MDLGSDYFLVSLDLLSRNAELYTIAQFIAALELTTIMPRLRVTFQNYESTPENNRRVVEPIGRCIANLRRHNPNHPLRQLDILFAQEDHRDVVDQFLVAVKQYGIHHLAIIQTRLPIQSLVDFCRDNTHLKSLEIVETCFSDEQSSRISESPQDGPQDASIIITLDELVLYGVFFNNSTAATKLTFFLAHINISLLRLDQVTARRHGRGVEDFDLQITERILSELTFPSVKRLELKNGCRIEHFQAAVVAGMATATELTAWIEHDASDIHARLDSVASMIRGASQLEFFVIRDLGQSTPKSGWWRPLYSAMDACVNVTLMDITPMKVYEKLWPIMHRNRDLARCIANPNTFYRSDQLPELMGRFANCPTGRYMLVRCLPGIISFDKIQCATNRKRKR